jgi:hypothetical protein
METELCKIFYKYKSDKCLKIKHSYSPEYYKYLSPYRETFTNILEIGIGNDKLMKPICGKDYILGASLKSWEEFFPNAKIYGLDILRDVLFSENRVSCFYTDQSNENELNKTIGEIRNVNNDSNLLFDLIIDDGSHIVDHMLLTFKTLSKYLKVDGLYIIEDILRKDLDIFTDIKLTDFEILKIHMGKSNDDDFIIYKKIK